MEWLPYGAEGRTLRGFRALADYLQDRSANIEASTYSYEAHGDAIVAAGHLRVRTGVALTDVQLWWIYHFRGQRLVRFEACTSRQAALDSLASAGSRPAA